MKSATLWLLLQVVFLCVLPERLCLACASCGSGTADPLVLNANERLKGYVGLSRSMARDFLRIDGSRGRVMGPSVVETAMLSLGIAATHRLFFTLTMPVLRNLDPPQSAFGIGDLSLAARTTVVRDDVAHPGIPQVQLIGGVRSGWASSPLNRKTKRTDELDTFGDGNAEARVGLDVWWQKRTIKAGMASFLLMPFGRRLPTEEWSRAGVTWRWALTTGTDLWHRGRWLVSLVGDVQASRTTSGARVAESSRRQVGLQTSIDLYATPSVTVRLAGGRSAWWWSYSAIRDWNGSLALMKVFH